MVLFLNEELYLHVNFKKQRYRFMNKILNIILLLSAYYIPVIAQPTERWELVRENNQKAFPTYVPAANYSGITYLGGNHYAVVDDKSTDDGFEMFAIVVDSLSGDIVSVEYEGHVAGSGANRDQEGIAYMRGRNTLLVSGEADNMIIEYDLDSRQTGRAVSLSKSAPNLGYEALTYSNSEHAIWTISESTLPIDGEVATPKNGLANRLRLQKFTDGLQKENEYLYVCETPSARQASWKYANGVSALAALDDGSLLVLEREFYVPELYSGAFALCRIYNVKPTFESMLKSSSISEDVKPLEKQLVAEWKTTLSLFRSTLANYEGMCLGPVLNDGSQSIILISDSQEQYGGVLKDWFKSVVVRKTSIEPQEEIQEADESEEVDTI